MDWGWTNKRLKEKAGVVHTEAKAEPGNGPLSKEESNLLFDIIGQLSSSGTLSEREKKKHELEERLSRLDDTIVDAVDKHHESFLTALRALTAVAKTMKDAKDRIGVLRTALTSCKTLLQCKRDHIRQLSVQSTEHREMLRLFDCIEDIKQVPERLDKLMASKHHVHAANLLVETLTTLESSSLKPVTGLHEIARDLAKRQERMHEVLISELHRHLYTKRTHRLQHITTPLQQSQDLEEDLDADPESDPRAYIIFIMKSLATLRKVPAAIAEIKQRLKTELALIVDRAIAYAEDHYLPKTSSAELQLVQTLAFDKTNSGPRVLFRVLTDIYDSLLQVMRGHQYVLETVRSMSARQQPNADESYSEDDVWTAIQEEVEQFIGQYLDQHAIITSSIQEPQQPNSSPSRKRKYKTPLFSFANSENAIAETSVNMERALREQTHSHAKATPSLADKYTSAAASAQKLLCKKAVSNITGIFKPTIFFTEEMEGLIAPPGEEPQPCSLRHFIEVYVRDRLLPHVQEDLKARLKAAAGAVDRPSDIGNRKDEFQVILQSTWSVYNLMGRLCGLMSDIPQSTSEFMTMVNFLLKQYWGDCHNRYIQLVKSKHSSGSQVRKTPSVLSAEWQADDRISQAIRRDPTFQSVMPVDDDKEFPDLLEESVYPTLEEADYLVEVIGDATLDKSDVMLETDRFKSLANMHDSLCWFAEQIVKVANMMENRPGSLAKHWADVGPIVDVTDDMAVREIARQLGSRRPDELRKLSKDFTGLAESCLITLRLELRTHALFYLIPAIRKTNYYCDIDAVETDPLVVSLNKDIASIEDALSSNLNAEKLAYLFNGLGQVMSNILIRNVRHIKRINSHGVKRMYRNIFAIQQNLTNVTKSRATDLDRALQYYELLYIHAEEVLQNIVANGAMFTESEYRVLINLISSSQKVPDPERHAQNIQDLGAAFHELV